MTYSPGSQYFVRIVPLVGDIILQSSILSEICRIWLSIAEDDSLIEAVLLLSVDCCADIRSSSTRIVEFISSSCFDVAAPSAKSRWTLSRSYICLSSSRRSDANCREISGRETLDAERWKSNCSFWKWSCAVSMRAMNCPAVTVSPSLTSNIRIFPDDSADRVTSVASKLPDASY